MTLATYIRGSHSPDCTGCPACSEHYAGFLTLSPAEWAERLAGRVPDLSSFGASNGLVSRPPSLLVAAEATPKPTDRVTDFFTQQPRPLAPLDSQPPVTGTVAPPPSLVDRIRERNDR